ncbi:MAG: TonB-dependent receptor domain-containing protein [Terriglobales bacterium]
MTRRLSSSLAAVSLVFVLLLALSSSAHAQTETGTIYGSVTDPTGAVIAGATIRLMDIDRGIKTEVATGDSGFYTLADIRPGHYQMEVEKTGFKLFRLTEITVNVQHNLEQNFKLAVGSASEAITVTANAVSTNTTDATVSTLIDNRFVENMPLNGRSFSGLIDLTPGVVLVPNNFFEQGQFSVNGQRPDANYFAVDGVSANLGTPAGANFSQGGTGQLPATSAFGGMSNLVSLDALQEFRIQTSTFAPEFGRTPGAQVSVVTKSGTNVFHGTAFEYFRNDVLDANDWFFSNKGVKKAALRQNDFGGVLGGPIVKDKLFFFGSYEGLRVRQPQLANTYVPTLATRATAPAAVQPLLNAFPLPTPGGQDFGDGTAAFTEGYSDPSSLNSYSGRVDYVPSQRLTLFGRYSEAPSNLVQRAGGNKYSYGTLLHSQDRTRTLTIGMNAMITSHLMNEFRFNYGLSRAKTFFSLDNFGGAVPPSSSELFSAGQSLSNSSFAFFGDFNPYGLSFDDGRLADNTQHQINLSDNFSLIRGAHQLKLGIDYRRLRPEQRAAAYQQLFIFGSLPSVLANSAPFAAVISRTTDVQMVTSNWSLFAQDTWKIFRNLSLAYGLRWEYNTVPSSPNGTPLFTVTQVTDISTATIAPPGTRLWHAQKDDFAPRLGLAWQPRPNLVIRAGGGIFYDLGYGNIAEAMSAFPYTQESQIFGTSFPLTGSAANPPPFTTNPPASTVAVINPSHVLPRTYEWNAAIEQSLSAADVFTMTYVGAGGRKLMRRDIYYAPNSNLTGEFDVLSNGASSSYNALQTEYRHRATHGLQTLLSYTWSHSIDNVSSDGNYANVPPGAEPASLDRGPSDYDIRHTFSGAVSYDIPGPGSGMVKQIFGSWSTDSIIYVRSAPPVNIVTGQNPYPSTILSGANSVQRPDLVPGIPLYLYGSQYPGGKAINGTPGAVPGGCPPNGSPSTGPFCNPPTDAHGNPLRQGDLGRNAVRGFGATQWNITLRRQFRLTERVSLQFRGDFFNILNHPNFGSPVNYLSAPSTTPFGYATQMLNNYLGSGGLNGGLNPLYQVGGPRSIQLALKLQF